MKKIFVAIYLMFFICSSAFGSATDDLFQAVQDENTTAQQVQSLIKRGANVNAVKQFVKTYGWNSEEDYYKETLTVLMLAVKNAKLEVVKALVNAGANVNYQNENGHTALAKAIFYSTTDVVKFLVASGADINARDNDDWTPLMLAIEGGRINIDVVKFLLACGADINARDNNGWTPLMHAIAVYDYSEGTTKMKKIQIFLKAGSNVNAKDKYGITPLMINVASGGSLVEYLLLKKAGADINAKDKDGWTPLMWAAAFDNIDAVITLLEAGVDINAKDKYGMTALFWAVAVSPMSERPVSDLVEILINAGADVKIKNKDGTNALLKVLMKKDFTEVKTTLGRNVDAKIAEKIATMRSYFFEELGAGDDDISFYNDKFEIIKNLRNAGVDLNAKNKKGRTALMEASILSDIDSVKALIDAGADVSTKNTNGKTAYDLAKTENVKKILLKK